MTSPAAVLAYRRPVRAHPGRAHPALRTRDGAARAGRHNHR
ncbi:hypothetical protein AAGW05_06610 [Arthrobacter sp. LAPM80]